MSRHVEGPWFRAAKNAWYVTHEGRQLSLGVSGKNNKRAAVEAWHRLLRDGSRTAPITQSNPTGSTIAETTPRFLHEVRARNKPATHKLYTRHLRQLSDHRLGSQPLATLTSAALSEWLYGLKVGSTTKLIVLRSVSVFLGWCVRHELIDKNPVPAVAKPKARSRGEEAVVSADDLAKLLELASPQLRLVLTVLHATGARPGEVCAITAENFDPEAGVVKLTEHKIDHTGRVRLIFLPATTVELLKGQLEKYGTGPLLRNRLGRAWRPTALAWEVNKLSRRAGVKVIPYGYRHSFATDALAEGVPDAQVAQLLGHGSTAMLHRHYSHLGSKARAMAEALKRVR